MSRRDTRPRHYIRNQDQDQGSNPQDQDQDSENTISRLPITLQANNGPNSNIVMGY